MGIEKRNAFGENGSDDRFPLTSAQQYFADISRLIQENPLLTAEEEHMLGNHIQRGLDAARTIQEWHEGWQGISHPSEEELLESIVSGRQSFETMLNSNLRLAMKLARRYRYSGLPLPDLIQIGITSLASRIPDFDPNRGVRFSTFIYPQIVRDLGRAAGRDDNVPPPYNMLPKINKVYRFVKQFDQENGRGPTIPEISGELSLTEEQIERVFEIVYNTDTISLDHAYTNNDGEFGEKSPDKAH